MSTCPDKKRMIIMQSVMRFVKSGALRLGSTALLYSVLLVLKKRAVLFFQFIVL